MAGIRPTLERGEKGEAEEEEKKKGREEKRGKNCLPTIMKIRTGPVHWPAAFVLIGLLD